MDENAMKQTAAQLRKPQGEYANQVALKMNTGNAVVNRRALEEMNLSAGDHVLEIGMGNGKFAGDVIQAAERITYTGADYSPEMVEAARELNKDLEGKANFIQADAGELPFPDASFTKVFTVNTVYFWDEPQKVLAELKRVLKPGGLLVVAGRPKASMKHYPFIQFGFTLYSGPELAYLLESAGFSILNLREEPEPDQDVNGNPVKVDSLIVVGLRGE